MKICVCGNEVKEKYKRKCKECRAPKPKTCIREGCDNEVAKGSRVCIACKEKEENEQMVEKLNKKIEETTKSDTNMAAKDFEKLYRFITGGLKEINEYYPNDDNITYTKKFFYDSLYRCRDIRTHLISEEALQMPSGDRCTDHVFGRTKVFKKFVEMINNGCTDEDAIDFLIKHNITIRVKSEENIKLSGFQNEDNEELITKERYLEVVKKLYLLAPGYKAVHAREATDEELEKVFGQGIDKTMARIFILEDDHNRISQFKDSLARKFKDLELVIKEDAKSAKEELAKQKEWDIIFLDHDLGGRIYVDSSEENTGYQVALFIKANGIKYKQCITHTHNPAGGHNIVNVLGCDYVPFANLIKML